MSAQQTQILKPNDVLDVSKLQKYLLLCANLYDDSVSIEQYGNTQAVRDAGNEYLDGLVGLQKDPGRLLVSTWLMNEGKLRGFNEAKVNPRLDNRNYNPTLGTPMDDSIVEMLLYVLDKTDRFEAESDVPVLTFSRIFTDGDDTTSQQYGPEDVREIVTAMLETNRHIIQVQAVEGRVNYVSEFARRGIPEHLIQIIKRDNAAIKQTGINSAKTSSTISMSGREFAQFMQTGIAPDDE